MCEYYCKVSVHISRAVFIDSSLCKSNINTKEVVVAKKKERKKERLLGFNNFDNNGGLVRDQEGKNRKQVNRSSNIGKNTGSKHSRNDKKTEVNQ